MEEAGGKAAGICSIPSAYVGDKPSVIENQPHVDQDLRERSGIAPQIKIFLCYANTLSASDRRNTSTYQARDSVAMCPLTVGLDMEEHLRLIPERKVAGQISVA